jgi:hypothetical protein
MIKKPFKTIGKAGTEVKNVAGDSWMLFKDVRDNRTVRGMGVVAASQAVLITLLSKLYKGSPDRVDSLRADVIVTAPVAYGLNRLALKGLDLAGVSNPTTRKIALGLSAFGAMTTTRAAGNLEGAIEAQDGISPVDLLQATGQAYTEAAVNMPTTVVDDGALMLPEALVGAGAANIGDPNRAQAGPRKA